MVASDGARPYVSPKDGTPLSQRPTFGQCSTIPAGIYVTHQGGKYLTLEVAPRIKVVQGVEWFSGGVAYTIEKNHSGWQHTGDHFVMPGEGTTDNVLEARVATISEVERAQSENLSLRVLFAERVLSKAEFDKLWANSGFPDEPEPDFVPVREAS